MPKNKLNLNEQAMFWEQHSRIIALEGDVRHTTGDIVEIKDSIKTIKENHLAHIQTSIEGINVHLARLDPQNKLIWKVIEYTIMAVVMAGIALIVASKV